MNDAILEKVRKLRALSSSSNVHEAAAAAAAAERLIQEHDIAEAELYAASSEADDPATKEDLTEVGSVGHTWKGILCVALCMHHSCTSYESARNVRVNNGPSMRRVFYVICGRPSDIATVRYLFSWLTAEIERLCAADTSLRGRTARNSFRLGAVNGVREAMGVARREARAAATSSALAVIDRRLDAAKALLPDNLRKGSRSSGRLDGSAYAAGLRAGKSIHQGGHLAPTSAGARLLGSGK